MLQRKTRQRQRAQLRPASGSPGKRCYAIGDVHGCLDHLKEVLEIIEEDIAVREPRPTAIVFMGDLIDRGPDSRGVVDHLIRYKPAGAEVYHLMGNHEEMLIRGLTGEPQLLRSWLENGGYACAQSYGVEIGGLYGQTPEVLEQVLASAIPPRHIAFLQTFLECIRFGDYLLVHAGIRPGVAIEHQNGRDMRWIREGFIESEADHGVVVVHGHTVSETIDERVNRIGIDTGAYETGVLTAIRIEDERRDFVQVTAPAPAPRQLMAARA